jgi:hypothetical protein
MIYFHIWKYRKMLKGDRMSSIGFSNYTYEQTRICKKTSYKPIIKVHLNNDTWHLN